LCPHNSCFTQVKLGQTFRRSKENSKKDAFQKINLSQFLCPKSWNKKTRIVDHLPVGAHIKPAIQLALPVEEATVAPTTQDNLTAPIDNEINRQPAEPQEAENDTKIMTQSKKTSSQQMRNMQQRNGK
jgi:hypothetical protein